LFSLFVVLVSVAAPVIAQTYECPMVREANALSTDAPSCCTHQGVVSASPIHGPAIARTCDCPDLAWDQDVSDQTRQTSQVVAPAASAVVAWFLEARGIEVASLVANASDDTRAGRSDAIWLRCQSIRC